MDLLLRFYRPVRFWCRRIPSSSVWFRFLVPLRLNRLEPWAETVSPSGSSCFTSWTLTPSGGGWASSSGQALVRSTQVWNRPCKSTVRHWIVLTGLLFFFFPPGEYLLFCKGADSSIFPRVVSGKVEQVKARVEQNAVVSVGDLILKNGFCEAALNMFNCNTDSIKQVHRPLMIPAKNKL